MAVSPLRKDAEGASGQRSCGAARDPRRHPPWTDRRPRAGLRAGQSCHFAAGAGSRLPALLPAQSKALPADRNVRARRSARARTGRGSRHPHRSAALPGLEKRRAGRRAAGHPRILARRPGELRDRLLVFVRGSADGGRHRAAPHHARLQRADVPHLDRHARGGPVPRTDGRVDAAADAARCHPRRADHDALSVGARRAGAYRQAGDDRHQGHHEAGLWRCRRSARRRVAGVLGLRGDAAIGDRDGEAGILHHALSRQHAGDRPAATPSLRLCEAPWPVVPAKAGTRTPRTRAHRLATLGPGLAAARRRPATPRRGRRSCPAIRPRPTPDGCARFPRARS